MLYNGMNDDDDSNEDVALDVDDDHDDAPKIQINHRFTKSDPQKPKPKENRGHIAIQLEEPTPTENGFTQIQQQQGFDGFPDTASPTTTTTTTGNDVDNAPIQSTTSPQYIVHNHVPDAAIEVVDDGSRSKKRKKKKKKKYKTSKGGSNAGGIALMPMSTNDVAVPTADDNNNGSGEPQMESTKKKKRKKSKKKKNKQRKMSRNERMKEYVRSDVKWWLFIGFMISVLVFCYSAINLGIAEDLDVFYDEFEELICHWNDDESDDPNAELIEKHLIGDVITEEVISNFFTSSMAATITASVGTVAGIVMICMKDGARNARDSLLVALTYCLIFVAGVLLLFVWNIMLCMEVIDQLNALMDGISQCVDESQDIIDNQQNANDRAKEELSEFEMFIVLSLPVVVLGVLTVWFIRAKSC